MKSLYELCKNERFEENSRVMKFVPLVISFASILYLLQYRFFPGKENTSVLFTYYRSLFLFALIFSLLFRLLLPLFMKIPQYIFKAGLFSFYYYAMFILTVFLTFLDLQISHDYSAYAVGLFMVAFLYRVDWRRYVLFSFSGFILFLILNSSIPEAGLEPERLLPLLIFTILSIYLVYFREKTRTQMLELKVKLEDSALKDPLTGLYNRRYLFDILPRRISLFNRYGDNTSVIIMDLDFFKKINDKLGHTAGDRVLKVFASLVSESIRDTDTAFRYGGEEFLILLNDSDREQAALLAERLRKSVESYSFDGVPWTVTVSIGVSEVRPGDNDDHLIERADKNLYEAKETGRNKVVK